jgi:DNA-directed RNA polymerase subunit RPC12/RpoP
MFSFCPHCGQSLDQEQSAGQAVACIHCGKPIGVVVPGAPPVIVDRADELIRQGAAIRCPLCSQLVELKGRSVAPHFAKAGERKLCPQSGKPVATPTPKIHAGVGKDLRHLLTRESIRVVSCRRGGQPRIEELALAFLDKQDRVRLQIEALRDILGPDFRMRDYPANLSRPSLAVWGSPDLCVVARKHERGGYAALTDAEIAEVVGDLRQHPELFFAPTA